MGRQGEHWKQTTLQTALMFPGVVFVIFFSLNLLVRTAHCPNHRNCSPDRMYRQPLGGDQLIANRCEGCEGSFILLA